VAEAFAVLQTERKCVGKRGEKEGKRKRRGRDVGAANATAEGVAKV